MPLQQYHDSSWEPRGVLPTVCVCLLLFNYGEEYSTYHNSNWPRVALIYMRETTYPFMCVHIRGQELRLRCVKNKLYHTSTSGSFVLFGIFSRCVEVLVSESCHFSSFFMTLSLSQSHAPFCSLFFFFFPASPGGSPLFP